MVESFVLKCIGGNIRKHRKTKKMTQEDLSVACSFEKARLSRIENGRANPTIKSLYKISKALDIEMIDLFEEQQQQQQAS